MLPNAPVAIAQTQENQQLEQSSTEQEQVARRQMAVRDAMLQVQEARLAYAAKRYTEAEEHYRNALAVIPKAPATKRQVTFIKQSLADALIARAIDYRAVGRYDEALDFLQEAVELDPKNNRAKQELTFTADPVRNNPAITPQHVGDVAEVQRLLELAFGYVDLGKFDEAENTFKSVLEIDPYNSAARRGMESVSNHRSNFYKSAREAARAAMLTEVDAKWEEDVPDNAPAPEAAVNDDTDVNVDVHEVHMYSQLLDRMVLPSIEFDDANIMEVVETLQNQIRRFEAQGIGTQGRRMNLTTNFGPENGEIYKQLLNHKIHLQLENVSLKEVLDYLSKMLELRYFYTEIGVELCLNGRDNGPLQRRIFDVPEHFFDADDDAEEEEDDGFEKSTVTVRRVSPKERLKQLGITFPQGATAAYNPGSRKLSVVNTKPNLDDIEDMLEASKVTDYNQIVLSVLAVEVSEKDLDQLGFEWLFNVGLTNSLYGGGGTPAQATSIATGSPAFELELGPNTSPYMSKGLRDAGALTTSDSIDNLIASGSASRFGAAEQSPTIFGVRAVWNVADVTVLMKGLAQKKGVDVLQNPKIILSPGNEEQVALGCVQELYYPTSWEQGKIEPLTNSNNNRNSKLSSIATGAFPSGFERVGCIDPDTMDGIGTILLIHGAEMGENNDGACVTLTLSTIIKDFQGFVNWGTPIHASLVDGMRLHKVELTPNHILMPVFKRSMENTQIKVAPGAVIVMGGLKESKTVTFEDKIPIMGDLPLVGRFFRSSGESKSRKALIFFVKVDVVDTTGRDITTGEKPSTHL